MDIWLPKIFSTNKSRIEFIQTTGNSLKNLPVDMAQDVLVINAKALREKSSLGLKYEEEWDKLCKENIELTDLRKKALHGDLRASRFRSVIWRLLLGALTPGFSNVWPSEASSAREHYITLKNNLQVIPCVKKEPNYDNPLSQHDKSTWHQYFCDKELRSLIRQDVIRTFPGVDFFRGEMVQEAMINILFCYARENPTMCYRQGMHEVLAPVLFVVHCDQQAFSHAHEQGHIREDTAELLNPKYLEADSYILFRRIMNAIEGSYLISNLEPTSTGHFPPCAFAMSSSNENQVIAQLNWIKERLLAPNDPQLYNHLEKHDIPLPLFGIRWLRLLFGREFPLQDLLVLWDAIFADNKSFDLVNYVVVSMLIAIRHILLNSDYTACLTNLMRYPPSVDISSIIEYALHLKYPKLYKAPPKLYFARNATSLEGRNNYYKISEAAEVKLAQVSTQKMKNDTINRLHSTQLDPNIIDGYALNDPEVLSVELKNAHTIMSLCRLKLLQYHHILEKVVPQNDAQAQQALTGIHELSSLLNIKRTATTAVINNVEPAYEAGEKLDSTSVRTKSNSSNSENNSPIRKSSVDMTVFKHVAIPIRETDNEVSKSWKLL